MARNIVVGSAHRVEHFHLLSCNFELTWSSGLLITGIVLLVLVFWRAHRAQVYHKIHWSQNRGSIQLDEMNILVLETFLRIVSGFGDLVNVFSRYLDLTQVLEILRFVCSLKTELVFVGCATLRGHHWFGVFVGCVELPEILQVPVVHVTGFRRQVMLLGFSRRVVGNHTFFKQSRSALVSLS